MENKIKLLRPNGKQLFELFKQLTHLDEPPKSKIYTTKKKSPVEAVSEFAPMGGVLISYPGTIAPKENEKQLPPSGPRMFGIPDELIVRMQQAHTDDPVHIFIFCNDSDAKKEVISNLKVCAKEKKLDFDPELIVFIPWDTDTYWTRDYGPWWIKNKTTGYFAIAKHIYTSLGGGSVGLVEGAQDVDPHIGSGIFRPNDDYGAVRFSDFINAPIRKWNDAKWEKKENEPKIDTHNWFFTGLLDVGGNYMVNGEGIIASSYLVATQNELPVEKQSRIQKPTPKNIEKRMKYILEQLNRFMGINKYHVLADPTGTYIGHIDCWGKYLSSSKVLIAQSQDKKINKGLDEISKSFEKEGFVVYRVMCQDVYIPIADTPATTAAYTNSLILNDYVYVPMAGKGYESFDKAAIKAYEKALPEHKVIGIIGKEQTPWLGTDAMHCRTRGVPRDVVDNWLKSLKLK